jgi:hypothetical protein
MLELNELDIINSKNKKEFLSKNDLKKSIKELEEKNLELKESDELKSLELNELSKENKKLTNKNEKLKKEKKVLSDENKKNLRGAFKK